MSNSITEIDRKGLFGRQASGLLSQEGDRVGQDLVAGIELNAIARVGPDLDHKAFELDEFFLGHFFIDAQVPEKAITTLTRGFPLSSVSSCIWTRIITSGFFARAFAHSCSIISKGGKWNEFRQARMRSSEPVLHIGGEERAQGFRRYLG